MLFLLAALAPALPFVSPMFSDHMVLQRDQKDSVWGWTTPGAKVTVTMNGRSDSADAGPDGKWVAKVGPFKAGGPYELTVAGPQTVTFSDILVGDVWICSGQSNMEFGLGNTIDPTAQAATANLPNVRLYAFPRAVSPVPIVGTGANWQVCTPESVLKDGIWGGFSAVGYYFGAKLNEDLKVPIGLVHTSWGGTIAEAWTHEPELESFPEFKGALNELNAYQAMAKLGTVPPIQERLDRWYAKYDAGTKANPGWEDPSLDDSGWQTMNVPGYFQQAGYPELVNNQSVVWLRLTFDVNEETANNPATLNMLVDDDDATWINGVPIGATNGVQNKRSYRIPVGTLKAGHNVIAVRVTDTGAPGGIFGDANSLAIVPAKGDPISLATRWKVKLGAKVTPDNAFPTDYGQNPNYPTVLYNGMISPIVPFGVKGAIWYQGESNAGRAMEYRTLLPAMITSWRTAFGQGDFPFLIVQLAGFGPRQKQPGDDAWAELREAQYLTAKNLPHTGIASAIDVGEEGDIHPKDKKTVGQRLALVAERIAYGQKVDDSGPTYKSMKVQGSNVVLTFDHTEGGLMLKGNGPLFAVCGEDKKWHWAEAKLDGATVTLSSPDVDKPVAVRYYWANFLTGAVVNGAGLPMMPFRTDGW